MKSILRVLLAVALVFLLRSFPGVAIAAANSIGHPIIHSLAGLVTSSTR